MSEIKILHLSDLHFDSERPKDTEIVLNALWKDLDNFKDIDLILFSGDLVKAGDKKEDFEKAHQVFIKPLLEKTNLSNDDFFIVPGNHDIQVSAIDETIEEGLKARLKDRESLNSFLDKEMENRFKHIERLNNFNDFKNNKFSKKHAITSNKLFSTYIIEKKKLKTGIVCLNSVWRATGKGSSHDRGKLLIGERQIDDAFRDIKECDIKIALFHHSLDWLMEFDYGDARRLLSREFDYLFCGHRHEADLEIVQSFLNKAVIIQCGCIYKGRNYYNGYTVLRLNDNKTEGGISLRTYFDSRRSFDKAIDKCPDGEVAIIREEEGVTYIMNGKEINTDINEINIPFKYLLKYSDSDLIETMEVRALPKTDEIIFFKSMPEKEIKKFEEREYKLFLENSQYFNPSLTSFYLIARKLFKDIKSNNFESCNHTFIYPIHQYLSEMIRESEKKIEIQEILSKWLLAKNDIPPTARDFAAFELGMSKAENAIDVLLEMVKNDYELFPIRNYSAMALGMIMRKNDERVYKLLNISFMESNEEIKKSIINSFLYILKYKEEN